MYFPSFQSELVVTLTPVRSPKGVITFFCCTSIDGMYLPGYTFDLHSIFFRQHEIGNLYLVLPKRLENKRCSPRFSYLMFLLLRDEKTYQRVEWETKKVLVVFNTTTPLRGYGTLLEVGVHIMKSSIQVKFSVRSQESTWVEFFIFLCLEQICQKRHFTREICLASMV